MAGFFGSLSCLSDQFSFDASVRRNGLTISTVLELTGTGGSPEEAVFVPVEIPTEPAPVPQTTEPTEEPEQPAEEPAAEPEQPAEEPVVQKAYETVEQNGEWYLVVTETNEG